MLSLFAVQLPRALRTSSTTRRCSGRYRDGKDTGVKKDDAGQSLWLVISRPMQCRAYSRNVHFGEAANLGCMVDVEGGPGAQIGRV